MKGLHAVKTNLKAAAAHAVETNLKETRRKNRFEGDTRRKNKFEGDTRH